MGKKLSINRQPDTANIDFEIQFYEGVVKQKSDFTDALTILGDLYTRKGLYIKGLEIDRRLSRLKPYDPYVFYNLACSYALLKELDKAFAAMKLAIQNGYNKFDFLEEDADLANLLQDSRFILYLSNLKREQRNRERKNTYEG